MLLPSTVRVFCGSAKLLSFALAVALTLMLEGSKGSIGSPKMVKNPTTPRCPSRLSS